MKVSRSTLYRWMRCYREQGLAGLVDGRGSWFPSEGDSELKLPGRDVRGDRQAGRPGPRGVLRKGDSKAG